MFFPWAFYPAPLRNVRERSKVVVNIAPENDDSTPALGEGSACSQSCLGLARQKGNLSTAHPSVMPDSNQMSIGA